MELKDIIKESVSISEDASFKDAVSLMISEKTNSLLVTDNNGILTGEVTVTDLLDAIVPEYLDGDSIAAHFASTAMFEEATEDTQEKQVKFFMSKTITPVDLKDGIMEVALNAIESKRASIPVIDDAGKPAGIISRRGLKHIIANALNIPDSE